MPTYDYECHGCGDTFEKFQSITARPVRRCPSCKTGKVRRLIGAGAGLIFKGSGFYITDYRSDKYKSEAKADKPPTDSSSKSGGDTSDKTTSSKKSTSNDASKSKA